MTSYNVASFLFRFITCPNCKHEYHFTTDGSGIDFSEIDFILWSFDVHLPVDDDNSSRRIYCPEISRCMKCTAIIWAEEDVNTFCKRMESMQTAWEMLNSTSRPGYLKRDEYLELWLTNSLSDKQRILALRKFWGCCMTDYELNYLHSKSRENPWPPSPNFYHIEKLLLDFPTETDVDKIFKAELLRQLMMYKDAIVLLKQVKRGNFKRAANYMKGICKRSIAHPVIIPPRISFKRHFKKWVNRIWPRTFHVRRLIMEDYF
jgi:hypothetical protein